MSSSLPLSSSREHIPMRVPDLTPGREDRGRLLCVCVMWAVARKNCNLSVLRVPSRHALWVDFGVIGMGVICAVTTGTAKV